MITTKDKLEFVFTMAKHGNNITLHECIRLMRIAAPLQRLAETACNRELTEREIRKEEKLQMDIIAILAVVDCEAKFGGDPRGCVVKIVVPDGHTNDWGQEGICVPA
jgi:hypothetical protein